MRIVAIVEGKGEVESVPLLIQRVGYERCDPPVYPEVERPIRIPASKLRKPHELRRAVQLAASRAGAGGSVLVLMDADDDCPAQLAPALVETIGDRGDVNVGVVLAKREYEAWFLAGLVSLRGHRGVRVDAEPPEDPEAIRGAKEWLQATMELGATYSPSVDQPALTYHLDLDLAGRADSFDKCVREIRRLIGCDG
jgi:hypothetical protein